MYAGVFFAIIGVALWLSAYYLSGYGAAILSLVALFIARKTWLVIRARPFKVIGPTHAVQPTRESFRSGWPVMRLHPLYENDPRRVGKK